MKNITRPNGPKWIAYVEKYKAAARWLSEKFLLPFLSIEASAIMIVLIGLSIWILMNAHIVDTKIWIIMCAMTIMVISGLVYLLAWICSGTIDFVASAWNIYWPLRLKWKLLNRFESFIRKTQQLFHSLRNTKMHQRIIWC